MSAYQVTVTKYTVYSRIGVYIGLAKLFISERSGTTCAVCSINALEFEVLVL